MKGSIILSVTMLLLSLSAQAEKIVLEAKDGFKLAASYVAADSPTKNGVLMLHQCNAHKGMYGKLAKSLAKQGVSSLALDFRSYGDSVTDEVSRKVFRENSKNRDEFVKKIIAVREYWPDDVKIAYEYLVEKVGSHSISFIGASCGGVQALKLAQQHKPNSFIFFSSGMDEENIQLFENVSDIPAMIIAAEGDTHTFKSSKVIYKRATTDKTKLKTYKGDGHGFPLFKKDPKLEQEMVDWFKANSR